MLEHTSLPKKSKGIKQPAGIQAFLENNVLHPLLNNAVIAPIDAVDTAVNFASKAITNHNILPEFKEYKIIGAKTFSGAWFAQNIASGLGMAIPYTIAGLAAHGALGASADTLGATGTLKTVLESRQLGMVAGAFALGGLEPIKQGQSRLGNAVGSASAFAIFGLGAQATEGLPIAYRLAANAPIGALGAITGMTSNDLISNGKLPNGTQLLDASITGATLNTVLPLGQDLLAKGSDFIQAKSNVDNTTASNTPNTNDQTVTATNNGSDIAKLTVMKTIKNVFGKTIKANLMGKASTSRFAEISSIEVAAKTPAVDSTGIDTGSTLLPHVSFRNPEVAKLAQTSYDQSSIDKIANALASHHTTDIRRYSTGGQSADTITDTPSAEAAISGKLWPQWDRDNMMQALAEYQASADPKLNAALNLSPDAWKAGLASSLKYQITHQYRFLDIMDGRKSGFDVSARPHIRYNPTTLEDLTDPWGNTQNDALASISYLMFHAANEGRLSLNDPLIEPYAKAYGTLLPHYFNTVHVWEDYDFGAWEDKLAEHASSIGMVTAALREQKTYLDKNGPMSYNVEGKTLTVASSDIASLLTKTEAKLNELLPNEFLHSSDGSTRTVDAALINPLYLSALSGRPLLTDNMTQTIINNVQTELGGNLGIARYPGDTWDGRTNRYNLAPDQKAQWTHVAPMISSIFAEMYQRTGNTDFLTNQTAYFNKGLGSIANDWKLPEAYIRNPQNTAWISDANKPLAWSQSSMIASLHAMNESLAKKP